MMPRPASPERREKIPRPITTTPADRKKSHACGDLEKRAVPKETSPNIGNVPSAKKNMMRNQLRKDPLESATICIDWVNPHGRKKVAQPMRRGAKVVFSILRKKENNPDGSVRVRLKSQTRLQPRMIMTSAARRPRSAVKVALILRALPRSPRSPPNSQNPTIRPV